MANMFGRAARGLPALLGVVLGILVYYVGRQGVIVVGCVIVAVVLMRMAATMKASTRPRVALLLIEAWILLAVALTALSTSAVLWLSLSLPSLIVDDKETVNAVTGAMVGAVSAYFAGLWTKEIAEVGGPFSPGVVFQAVLEAAFKHSKKVPPSSSIAYQAIYFPRVDSGPDGSGPNGWGLKARWDRARLISEYLRQAHESG